MPNREIVLQDYIDGVFSAFRQERYGISSCGDPVDLERAAHSASLVNYLDQKLGAVGAAASCKDTVVIDNVKVTGTSAVVNYQVEGDPHRPVLMSLNQSSFIRYAGSPLTITGLRRGQQDIEIRAWCANGTLGEVTNHSFFIV